MLTTSQAPIGRFGSLRARAYAAQITLGASAAYWAVEALGAYLHVSGATTGVDSRMWAWLSAAEALHVFLFAVTGVAFVAWSYRAHANLGVLGRTGMRHQDRAAIWWWLVPLAGFVVPFRVSRETARGSVAPLDDPGWSTRTTPAVATWWTIFFPTGIVLSQTGTALILASDLPSEVATSATILLIGSLAMVVAAVTGMAMVQTVTSGQIRLAREKWPPEIFGQAPVAPEGHGSYEPPSPVA